MTWIKLDPEERRLWAELGARRFDPESSRALPRHLPNILRREFQNLVVERVFAGFLYVWALGIFFVSQTPLVIGLCVVPLATAIYGYFVLCLTPSARWLHAIALIVNLSRDLTPDSVVRYLLEAARLDRRIRYKKNHYTRVTFHKALELALLRAKDFVATDDERLFLIEIARKRNSYPRELRVAALNAVSPPGAVLSKTIRAQIAALNDEEAFGQSVTIIAGDVLRRSWPMDADR